MDDNIKNANASAEEKTDKKTEDKTVKEEKTAAKTEDKTVKAEIAENSDKKADAAQKPAVKNAADTNAENEGEEETEDEEEINIFDERKSVPLTPGNSRFYRSKGGLISMDFTNDDGTPEQFERIIVLRALPISNPDEFISIREPESKLKRKSQEIGLIRRMSDFDAETVKLLNEELDRRYFTPEILKIYTVKEKFGYSYWEADTTAGKVSFVLNSPFYNIRILEDERIFINDMDGNCFVIHDPSKLDKASYKKIEIYI